MDAIDTMVFHIAPAERVARPKISRLMNLDEVDNTGRALQRRRLAQRREQAHALNSLPFLAKWFIFPLLLILWKRPRIQDSDKFTRSLNSTNDITSGRRKDHVS